MPDNLKSLYQAHLKETVNRYTSAAGDQNKNGILIAAGSLKTAFLDDFTYPFKVNPHFKNLVPVTDVPESFVLLRMGEKPKLLFRHPRTIGIKRQRHPKDFG